MQLEHLHRAAINIKNVGTLILHHLVYSIYILYIFSLDNRTKIDQVLTSQLMAFNIDPTDRATDVRKQILTAGVSPAKP